MWRLLKKVFNLFVPTHIKDPGLVIRMIRSKNPAAWFTLFTTGLSILVIPLDTLLARWERRRYEEAPQPEKPIIFVCGAPRTGTTLMGQFLIKNLPVSYFNNLTSIFVKSPITANLIYRSLFGEYKKVSYNSYYSKTTYFTGPNDAFYLWNRWMEEDGTGMQCALIDDKRDDMVRFFGAYEAAFQKPLVSKNNSLNTRAYEVAESLDNAYFICMTRDDAYLAQALLQARTEIQGDMSASYGVDNPNKHDDATAGFVADVCDQVLYHKRKIHEQQQIIGAERYWIIQYEDFCRDPQAVLRRVYTDILNMSVPEAELAQIEPFNISNKIKLEHELFEEIETTLAHLQADPSQVEMECI